MNTLYLTKAEMGLHKALPTTVVSGMQVEEEVLTYEDSETEIALRFQVSRFHDPVLLEFREKVSKAKDQNELVSLVKSLDISKVNQRDGLQLLFALGPAILSSLIEGILRDAKTTEDLEQAVAFSVARHGALRALTSVS